MGYCCGLLAWFCHRILFACFVLCRVFCRQYAGTGALKSGFTRTGKRTLGGLIDDGVKSMTRYYLNNFKVCAVMLCF